MDSLSKAEVRGNAWKELIEKGQLSPRKAASLFGVHYLTLRDYIQRGYVQTIQIGSRHYITLEEVERFRTEGALNPEGGGNTSPSNLPRHLGIRNKLAEAQQHVDDFSDEYLDEDIEVPTITPSQDD